MKGINRLCSLPFLCMIITSNSFHFSVMIFALNALVYSFVTSFISWFPSFFIISFVFVCSWAFRFLVSWLHTLLRLREFAAYPHNCPLVFLSNFPAFFWVNRTVLHSRPTPLSFYLLLFYHVYFSFWVFNICDPFSPKG